MQKRKLPIIFILGVILVLVSILITIVFFHQMYYKTKKFEETVLKLKAVLPENPSEVILDPSMPVLELEGVDYAALLEIPSMSVALPVANEWKSSILPNVPSRFYGYANDGTLVIGGADFPGQFDFCNKIEHGTHVTVTDMTGKKFTYTVCDVNRSKKAETDWLADTKYDLTLFCRDMYSFEYIAVRCCLD